MKFLVIRFSSIGDMVLTTPVVRCLKKQMPDAEIHYLTKLRFHEIVDHNPYIDKIHLLDDSMPALLKALKNENFDFVVDLHNNLRTSKVKSALKVKSASFPKLNIEKWMMTALKINRLPQIHIVDRYLQTLKSFSIKNDGLGLDYFIPEKDKVKESDIPASHLAGYVGIVIGAAHNTKKLPLHKLKELSEKLDHPIILLGGKEDYQTGKQIAESDPVKIYNACGKFSLHESADLVRRAKLIVSHDTGLMHIAAAFQKPIISVWGNTIPGFGMTPYYGTNSKQQYDVFEINNLRCRPCSKIGYDKCPKKHFKCMEEISIDALVGRINERLGRSKIETNDAEII
ncbi:MAG: glycosyl transferase [Bacteroidetes bacterium]|nr:MAG: glycosyl transferase [Bacteroidota bacterium]